MFCAENGAAAAAATAADDDQVYPDSQVILMGFIAHYQE